MSKIPDRWIPYKACGDVIEGTRFICFKVPLRKSVQSGKQDIKEIWDIPALLAKVPNLGAVIDLTNTSRYYNPQELQAKGVLYKKILIPGHVIPPQKKVTEFMDTVDEFLGKHCDFLVGVHCTHGLNRTGYMVVRYMRDRLGIPAKKAIKQFEKARGYQIEREHYVANLLGNEVPSPDVGNHTEVKPIDRQNSLEYRSPLGYDEEEDMSRNSYSRSRYTRTSRSDAGTSSSKGFNESSNDKHEGGRRDSSSGKNSNSRAYDFRHDY